jgi:outer membrane protein assembly factor BamB
MRIITLAGEDSSGTLQAGKLAENAINDLVRKVNGSIYDELEKEAKGKLDALGAQGNPDELMALAENYPNSKVASDALMRAAEMYEKTGKPRMATQVLRRLNWKYNYRFSAAERAKLIEAMARNYLKVGNTGAALGRLQKGNSLMPDEKLSRSLNMPDGKPLVGADGKIPQTIGDAAEVLQEIVQKRAVGAVPDVRIPLPPTQEDRIARKPPQKPFDENPIVIPGVQAILESPVDLADGMRTDRIVAWAGRKLACFTAGSKDARWVNESISDNALGLAWLDEKLVAWGESEVALIDGESGKTTWRVDLRNLPAVDLVVAGGAADGPTPAPAGGVGGAEGVAQQEAQLRANMIRLQGARRVRPGFVVEVPQDAQIPGGIPGIAAANNNAVADGKERVLHVRPLTDRLIVSTTTGRILAIDLGNGRLNWQTRLSASVRQIQQTLATDDFTAVRLAEGANVQLVVLDTYNGQQIWRRSFMVSQQNWPMNCVLAPDGMLVWTSAVGMTAQDLYEPTDRPRWEISRNNRSYVGMLQPDQLIVNGTEVLAVSDNGKFIDRRSIQSGQKVGDPLSTGSPSVAGVDNSVRLRMSGPRLYAVGSKSMVPYNLEQNTATPPATMFADVAILPDDTMITKSYVVLPGQVVGREGSYTLQAYSRLLVPMDGGKVADSGLMVYKKDITEPAKITSWAAVDGGIYYLTGDDRLVFLKGTR